MIKGRWIQAFMALSMANVMVGCVPALLGPTAKEPGRTLPAAFPVATHEDAPPPHASEDLYAQRTWDKLFDNQELEGLIEATLAGNQDLSLRVQEIAIAHNEAMARQGEYWPRISASVGAGIEKVGTYTSQGASDDASRLSKNLGDFRFGLVSSWEADIWAKLRNAKKAADLRFLASIEGQRFLVTQLVAEVARLYYELIALDRQIDILNENIRLQEGTLALVKLEKEAARVTELAVQRFEAEVLHYKSRSFKLAQARVQTENQINFLMGRYPQRIERNGADFHHPPPALEAGVPAHLLENRTDVRQAELALRAAKLDVKSAKSAFYPSLTIEAGIGYRAFNPAHLLATPASLVYDAVGGLVAPLVNRRAIAARYETANARQIQAVVGYEQTLLQAYTDVANQLAAVENWHGMHALLAQEAATLSQAVQISTTLFQAARAEYIEVLTARRDYLETQMELVEVNKRRFVARVNLYQALGGGWRSNERPTPLNATPAGP